MTTFDYGRFIKVFCKTNTCRRWPLLSHPKKWSSCTSLTVILNKVLNLQCWNFCKWIKLMICISIKSIWAFQWKMSFNPDLSKQAQDFFRRKTKEISHPLSYFINNIVLETQYQKHLGKCFLIASYMMLN